MYRKRRSGMRKTRKKTSRTKRRIMRGGKRSVRRNSMFNKAHTLSAPLQKVVGASSLSRPQVVKRVWKYIHSKGLQDKTKPETN